MYLPIIRSISGHKTTINHHFIYIHNTNVIMLKFENTRMNVYYTDYAHDVWVHTYMNI